MSARSTNVRYRVSKAKTYTSGDEAGQGRPAEAGERTSASSVESSDQQAQLLCCWDHKGVRVSMRVGMMTFPFSGKGR